MNPTPEQLQKQINDLTAKVRLLEAASTIPYSVDQAFRSRLEIGKLAKVTLSTKASNSEDQAVNEGGTGSYSVLKPPDGFAQVNVGGTIYYIPVFT